MRVLITGGAGFIGSHTADLLAARGDDVRLLDNLSRPVHRGRPAHLPAAAEFVEGDVRHRRDLSRALDGVEAVFHLAAHQDYLPDYSTFFDVNATGTALLFELIAERARSVRRVVLASSQSVYGEGRHRCAAHGVVHPPQRIPEQLARGEWEVRCPRCGRPTAAEPTDETVVAPHTPYAISKYTQELIAQNLGRRLGVEVVALRYSITQGPRQSPRNAYSGVLRIFAMRARAGLPCVAYEDGLQRRDYVDARDVARANVLALDHPDATWRAFNVGSGRATTVLEFAAALGRVLGRPLDVQTPGEVRVGDVRHIVSDVSALRALGWAPRVPLETTLRDYLGWLDEQGAGDEAAAQADAEMRRRGVVVPAAALRPAAAEAVS